MSGNGQEYKFLDIKTNNYILFEFEHKLEIQDLDKLFGDQKAIFSDFQIIICQEYLGPSRF